MKPHLICLGRWCLHAGQTKAGFAWSLCSVEGAFSVGKGLCGTGDKRSVKRDVMAVLVNVQSPGGLLTCAQTGKRCGREGGRFSKEVTGPDYSNVLIMSQ